MPMKLNVGVSKKVGEPNFGSRGASVNLEIELDSQLVGEPARLHERIRQCFGIVRASLTEELNGHGEGHSISHTTPAPTTQVARPAPATAGGNGQPTTHPNGQRPNGPRPATPAQVKAIYGIARKQRVNLVAFLQERFQVSRPDDLAIGEASQVIDELRASENANAG